MLEIEDLHTFYGNIHALKGISLTVNEGEIVALLGSNGAGKTTTLRSITGLERIRSGRVRLAGHDITNRKTHVIVAQGFGHVPEGRRIFSGLTVEENLTLGGYLLRRDNGLVKRRRERVYEIFPRLAERREQLAGTLSGGEQQMLAIGRALMMQPKVLALDEPSMGLAPLLIKTIFNIIQQIRDMGTAILLVEQNAKQALALADRAYVLENGKVVLSGEAEKLSRDPRVRLAYLGGHIEEAAESVRG
ncbi:MAG: ABC transporter ATP-binding protein [Alicyclobacillus macrosporangiidus]|uniref:ABC transporter ATP-binding protein n=1 Tax=Alicyclobacillus macrosporangiidus TaxID=392015 RepID=UPI0026F33339|nr:ABC transporter ATP-binding protein [Alicyclobacillus macrosporangiidus]MCL6597710.1 ABC transporter ATP-binding protein [Alicyclobacillus macrosporangiidus]